MRNMRFSALSAVLLVSSSWVSSGVIVRHYNEINRKDVDTFEKFQDEYMTLAPGSEDTFVTTANILLGVTEPQVRHHNNYFLSHTLSCPPLATMFLMFVAENHQCQEQIETAAFRGAYRHAGGAVLTILSMPASAFPYPIEGCAEVFFYQIGTPLDEPSGRTSNKLSCLYALLTISCGIIVR